MSELVVMPARSTRTIVEQYLGEHLAGLDIAADVPETGEPAVLPVVSAAAVDVVILEPVSEAGPETASAETAAEAPEVAEAVPESATAPAAEVPVTVSEIAPIAAVEAEIPAPVEAAEPEPVAEIPTAEPDPSAMIAFRVGPLRFALSQSAVAPAAPGAAVEVDAVALVPAAYAAIAGAGRGAESVALACGVVISGVHAEGVMNVTQEEIRPRVNRGSEPWIAGTTLKPARFVLDVDALVQAFGRQ